MMFSTRRAGFNCFQFSMHGLMTPNSCVILFGMSSGTNNRLVFVAALYLSVPELVEEKCRKATTKLILPSGYLT
jgi:hypothetical protein